MARFGHPPDSPGAGLPVHVILRAPEIFFPADSPISMVDDENWAVERLSLHADTFQLDPRTRSVPAFRPE